MKLFLSRHAETRSVQHAVGPVSLYFQGGVPHAVHISKSPRPVHQVHAPTVLSQIQIPPVAESVCPRNLHASPEILKLEMEPE